MSTTVVSERWTTARLGWLFQPISDRGHEDAMVLSVYRDHGVIPKDSRTDNFNRTPENLSNYQLVRPGDLVVNRMKAWQGSLGISEYEGIVSPDYEVLRPITPGYDYRFVHSLLRSRGLIDQYALRSTGIRPSQWRLYWDEMKTIEVSLPSAGEQRAIADYLDRETARIDTLIEEQERLIELLHERRHSLIDGVFDSQPVNTRLQNACTDVVDCPHTTPEVAEDGVYEAVRTASVRNGKFRPGNGLPVSAETWEARNAGGAPSVGDVLFTREAPAGEACMVPNEQICLGQRMVLLRIDDAVCVGKFLLWQIYSDRVQDHFLLSANGSTVANVRLPILRTTPIWLPSLAEQRQIVAYLDEQTSKIDKLVVEAERFIELSRERRSALITAAVTGQIDVRRVA
ncbi:restriction endonuclease subunit S [Streptomyces sp. NPDC051172]|uniref:restriction endonuclease subunit S n=1 Tax=Streptomyces sp. NPDC051172 TaxID=3155796 RepID=UPI003444F1E4